MTRITIPARTRFADDPKTGIYSLATAKTVRATLHTGPSVLGAAPTYQFTLTIGGQPTTCYVLANQVRVVAPRRRLGGHGDYAGLVEWRRNRETGVEVALYRSAEQGLDDDGGKLPYTVVCETHKQTLAVRTRKLGVLSLADPWNFCSHCRIKREEGREAEDWE